MDNADTQKLIFFSLSELELIQTGFHEHGCLTEMVIYEGFKIQCVTDTPVTDSNSNMV